MAYYLQDSNSVYWQLGITTLGQITTTVVGTQVIVPLVLRDVSLGYWQLSVSILGQVTQTSVGATDLTEIILFDSNGQRWLIGVTVLGQLTRTPFFGYAGAVVGPVYHFNFDDSSF